MGAAMLAIIMPLSYTGYKRSTYYHETKFDYRRYLGDALRSNLLWG